ncbi:FAD-dependent oxidoreductase [Actinophytocola oryzae]|uniref:Pyridine nucleotide-disulfide oxidoreductase n=1 Tax=Actinophytocola oryzae TaxID=502181 RepID=A0A4V3FQU8_9PSEU|nr:FAD-dependent oxidoreductase [Actinophytocola oryzae]TDV41081.1 pyridine nucleotide-disulfide oxidoreductase [Actinophytocola oryzae]
MTRFVPHPRLLASPRHRDWPACPQPDVPARPVVPPASADVVIVGAGPAGLAVAAALWHLGVHDVVVLDRTGAPVGRFLDRVDRLDQRVLRSPYEHHPGVEGYRDCELRDFARLHWSLLTPVERREIRMSQAGHRSVVPVDVFAAYCLHTAVIHRVTERLWPGEVTSVEPAGDRVTVAGNGFRVDAGQVVLCLGEERRDAPPAWLAGDRPAEVGYWDEPVPEDTGRQVVVGAGLTAAHLVHGALDRGARVDWVLRADSERYQCSDVNASFFRAEGRSRFDSRRAPVPWADRLALMSRERRASVMFEFQPLFRATEADGRLTVHRASEVRAVHDKGVELADGMLVTGDHTVFALGTVPQIGTGLLPDDVVGARDGWPDLDERTLAYRRAPRVFAAGAAACMVLGPAARNIDGHRVATARIAATIAATVGAAGHD